MTTAAAQAPPRPSKLAEKRRWVNVTKLLQAVQNRKQGDFVRVPVGGCVEGAWFADVCKQPTFKEVLDHIKPVDLMRLIKKEDDLDLLIHLSNVERYSEAPRSEVMGAFFDRIGVLEEKRKKEEDEE